MLQKWKCSVSRYVVAAYGNSSCLPRVSHTESKTRPAGLLVAFLFCGCSGLMPIGVSNGS
ncbi:hypothetical protein D3C77_713200 [compost metagenome]